MPVPSQGLALGLSSAAQLSEDGLRWPLGSGTEPFPLQQTYGQFEGCGHSRGLHHGIDVAPVQNMEPVHAIEKGVVTHLFDKFADYSGVVVTSDETPNEGFLYLHLDTASIQVDYDKSVEVGDVLGYVALDFSPCANARHLHLARIADYPPKPADKIPGNEFAVRNPLRMIASAHHANDSKPGSLNGELAIRDDDGPGGNSVSQDLTALPASALDVVVRVEDLDGLTSDFRLAPYELELRIESVAGGATFERIVRLDGPLPKDARDIYNVGEPLDSEGCCPSREYRQCFIPTNAHEEPGGAPSRAYHWSPEPGEYRIHVTFRDAALNEYSLHDPEYVTVTVKENQ
jgi:hypothetical protein